MIKTITKCMKCKTEMRDEILTDKGESYFTQLKVFYCPNCIELGDVIKGIVWCKTIYKSKVKRK